MKKIYSFVTAIIVTVLCLGIGNVNAQAYLSEDFSGITDAGNQQCESVQYAWADTTFEASYLGQAGWTCWKLFPANGKLRFGAGSAQGWLQTPPIDCSGNNGDFRVSFDAKAWNGSSESKKLYICMNFPANTASIFNNSTAWRDYIVDSVENLPNVNSSSTTDCDMAHYTVYLTGGTASTKIAFVAQKANNSRFFIDNIVVESANVPDIDITGETALTSVANESITTTIHANGHNLDVNGTTSVSITGTGFTVTPATINNSDLMNGVGTDITISFVSATAGDFTGVLTLTNASVTKNINITATCFNYVEVETLADLREKIDWSDISVNSPDSTIYKYVGEAVVTAANSYQGQKVIQDATAAIFIFDPSANITTPLSVGDKITGITGTLTNYFGYLEFTPKMDVERKISSYNDVEALTIDINTLNNTVFMDEHQSELVTLEGVSFVSTGTFATGNYAERLVISQNGVVDTAIYTFFRNDVDYLGTAIPTRIIDITGINYFSSVKINPSNNNSPRAAARYYVVPRSSFDFLVNDSFVGLGAENEMSAVKVYPNPTNGMVTVELNENATNINVYDIYGKLVNAQNATMGVNTINLSNVATGVYFLRIFNENTLVGTSKIVRQ